MSVLFFSNLSSLLLHRFFQANEPGLFSIIIFYFLLSSILFQYLTVHQITLIAVHHFCTLFLSITFYRTSSFHPLAKFNGPTHLILSKFSSYPAAIAGFTHVNIQRLHRSLKSHFVRIGPNELSVTDLSLIKIICSNTGWDKGSVYHVPADLKHGNPGLNEIISFSQHNVRRKLWQPAFSPDSMRGYLDLIRPRVHNFISFVDSSLHLDKPLAINRQFGFVLWDIMLDLAFSGTPHPEMLRHQKDDLGVFSIMQDFLALATVLGNTPYLAKLITLIPVPTDAISFLRHCNQRCKQRYQNDKGTARKDVFSHLAAQLDLEQSTSSNAVQSERRNKLFKDLQGDCVTLTVAGADTTSATLTVWMYNVLSNEGLWRELQKEMNLVIQRKGGNDEFDPFELEKEAPLLEATILETLRFSPVVPYGPLQLQAPENGFVLPDGRYIPGGTKVVISPYCVQRMSEYFHRPDEFLPQRWLPGWTEKHVPEALIAFFYGSRSCIGKRLAMLEIRLFAASMLSNFDAILDKENEYNHSHAKSYFTTQFKKDILVRFRKRNHCL